MYIDSVIRANLPSRAAKDLGAKVVIGVLVDEPLIAHQRDRYFKFRNIDQRISDIVLAVKDEHQLPYTDVLVHPDVHGIAVDSKNPAEIWRAIRAGEAAARRAMPDIKRALGLPTCGQTVAGRSSNL